MVVELAVAPPQIAEIAEITEVPSPPVILRAVITNWSPQEVAGYAVAAIVNGYDVRYEKWEEDGLIMSVEGYGNCPGSQLNFGIKAAELILHNNFNGNGK